ncbi:MAG TPA: PepSY-associated TM helix domain-containing protein [Candidatus Acidoferrales bacterium]|nr:PepSY-associated TM helix domain-containing protein [Candidatus Acidoferrales bacterium]
MDARKLILKLHLYLGLVSAIFLVILGLTGSVMAFEGQLDHWLHPGRWYVTVLPQTLPESQLVQIAEQRFAPDGITAIQIAPEANIAQRISLAPPPGEQPAALARPIEATVNQYDGSILSVHAAPTTTEATLNFIHQFHLRLVSGEKGQLLISFVGLILVFEVPLGVVLWWRTKRASVKWKSSGFRISFDLHHLVGVYFAAFLFLAAVTGVFIGFDFAQSMFYRVTHSAPNPIRPAASTVIPGAAPVNVDRVIAAAHQAMPEGLISIVQFPNGPRAVYQVILRMPGDAWSAVHGLARVDQYSGKVLTFTDLYASPGYRAIRFNRSLHTGDIFGLPSQIIVSLSSLALVVMVITGFIIWWKKLAI